MQLIINDIPHTLPDGATLVEALRAIAAVPPFAVAVNREFVPRSTYAQLALQNDDRIEVIRPVTGG